MQFGKDGFSLTFEIPRYKGLPGFGPESVFHYTGVESLLGMINRGEMWATNAAFLNDSSEVSHGINLLREVWEQVRLDTESGLRDKLEEQIEIGTSMYGLERFFVISASSEQEDAAQFERYGEYSIELDSQVPLYATANRPGFPDDMKLLSLHPAWRPVAYEKTEKVQRCKDLIHMLAAIAQAKPEWAPRQNEILTHWHSWWIANVVVGLKDRSFRAENEVRFVMLTEQGFDDVHSRAGKYGNETPFVKVSDISGEPPNALPIRSIRVSPKRDAREEIESIKAALQRNGIEATISVSDIPLR